MKAGRLNQRVVVERPLETQGDSGAMTVSWTAVATVWAEVAPATTRLRERLVANQVLADADTVIRMRHAPIVAGIDATWRLRLGATIYNIIGVANVRMEDRELEVLCVTGKNDG